MLTKKRMAAVLITVAALLGGSIGVASAGHGPAKADAKSAERMAKHADHAANHAAHEALITSVIGLDAATIKTRLQAGETLATIAGAKKDALIAAIVAAKTTEINARVAAGTMTAADASAHKADLVAHVTERINSVGHKGHGPKAGKGKRH